MSDPTTLSSLEEQAKRNAAEMMKSAGTDWQWREKQAENWGFIRAFMENQVDFNHSTKTWQEEHQNRDDASFVKLNTRLEEKVQGVSSSVVTLEKKDTLAEGKKKNLLMMIAVIAWLIPLAISVMAAMK
jgi:hypothetical protein